MIAKVSSSTPLSVIATEGGIDSGLLSEVVRRISSGSPAIGEIWLFGSRARGDYDQESDVDIYAISKDMDHDSLREASLDAGVSLWQIGIPVDFVMESRQKFERDTKRFASLEWNARTEGKQIYG